MKKNPLPRLDEAQEDLRRQLLPFCRLARGGIWEDAASGHRVACIDSGDASQVAALMHSQLATLAVHDPPYNLVAFGRRDVADYMLWCNRWVSATHDHFAENASLYVWLGADQNDGFQPLADFMVMMRSLPFKARSFITMRNQRGYGTQANWMAVRQELLYYVKGKPVFDVEAEYTDIPKILRGYYKEVDGHITENLERGRSDTIRAGNVWVDVQQVFYRMDENVSGCYAQKALKAIERIIQASSARGDIVLDLFAHSGATLLAAERLGRVCYTADIDPLFCELTIRRLEHFRATGRLGWQNSHAFEAELPELSVGEASVGPEAPLPQTSLF